MLKFKKGDEVVISAGKDKGKKGKIDKVLTKLDAVFIPGLNVYKKHLKKRDEKNPGGIVSFSRPLPYAAIAFICPKCGRQTRVGFNVKKDKKVRICHKCNSEI